MIEGTQNYVYTLQSPQKVGELEFKQGQEFNIINEVVYMEGFPLPLGWQAMVLKWIRDNQKTLFVVMNRNY
jgi:hypothetical protein